MPLARHADGARARRVGRAASSRWAPSPARIVFRDCRASSAAPTMSTIFRSFDGVVVACVVVVARRPPASARRRRRCAATRSHRARRRHGADHPRRHRRRLRPSRHRAHVPRGAHARAGLRGAAPAVVALGRSGGDLRYPRPRRALLVAQARAMKRLSRSPSRIARRRRRLPSGIRAAPPGTPSTIEVRNGSGRAHSSPGRATRCATATSRSSARSRAKRRHRDPARSDRPRCASSSSRESPTNARGNDREGPHLRLVSRRPRGAGPARRRRPARLGQPARRPRERSSTTRARRPIGRASAARPRRRRHRSRRHGAAPTSLLDLPRRRRLRHPQPRPAPSSSRLYLLVAIANFC